MNDLIEIKIENIFYYKPLQGYALLIKSKTPDPRQMTLVIGHQEAQSIALSMEGLQLPRPNTHDLVNTVIRDLSPGLKSVVIYNLRNNTFYAKLQIERSQGLHEIDCRPSDAIAVALRSSTPLFIKRWIFDKKAAFVSLEESTVEEDTSIDDMKRFAMEAEKKIELEKELEEAVKNENYEKAAEIRDILEAFDLSN